jgi:hypothetical protein
MVVVDFSILDVNDHFHVNYVDIRPCQYDTVTKDLTVDNGNGMDVPYTPLEFLLAFSIKTSSVTIENHTTQNYRIFFDGEYNENNTMDVFSLWTEEFSLSHSAERNSTQALELEEAVSLDFFENTIIDIIQSTAAIP